MQLSGGLAGIEQVCGRFLLFYPSGAAIDPVCACVTSINNWTYFLRTSLPFAIDIL